MSRCVRWAVVAVTVLSVGACDGDEGADSPSTSSTNTTAPSTTTPTSTVPAPTTAPAVTAPLQAGPTSSAPEVTPVPGATSDIDRPPVPAGSEGEELGPLGSTDIDVDTGEGTVQIGDADVPGLAAGFPVPTDLDVQLASETATDAGFTGVAPGSVSELGAFYREALPASGYAITGETGDGDAADAALVLLSFESASQIGSVVITRAPGESGTSILVTIQQR